MGDTDSQLAESYKAGQHGALESLYWRHAERVWRYARFFADSEDGAAEIVQETFVRVARNLASFEGRSKFTTWMYLIVRSVAIDHSGKRRRAPQAMEDARMNAIPSKASEPMDHLIGQETRTAVRRAVGRLPENEREAVILCELQDFSIREAGEVLGWSDSRVKVMLFRGRRRLKEMLATYVGVGTSA